MGTVLPYSIGPTPPYDASYDTAFPVAKIPWFGNDRVDDCVIVARAHHTIRLDYAAGRPVPAISDLDVTTEYNAESQISGTMSLDLDRKSVV